MGLDISPEKSQITNVRKGKTEFLGLIIYAKKSKKNKVKQKYVAYSNISDKAKLAIINKLKDQVKVIKKEPTPAQVNKLNAMILGIHQYYKVATHCSLDCKAPN